MEVAINAQLVSFGQSYRNAGVSRYTYSLLEGLSHLESEQRYTIFINPHEAAAATAGPLGQVPCFRFVPNSRPITNPVQRVAWEQLALPRELRRIGADVFHSPVNVLPARLPCASVVTIHDLAFLRYPQYFRLSRRYYQRILTRRSARSASLIAAVSESTKRDIVECFGVPAERVRVIYTAVAPDFRPVADPHLLAAFRARYHLPERYLLYLGTLEPRKNLERLIEAYARLRRGEVGVPPLVIAGAKGWYYQSLFERARALRAEDAITFVGYVSREEQPLWYAGATIFIYPSLYEGFGLPVLEALACGTPTITSNVSSLPEAAGPAAMQVGPSDADSLATAIAALLRDEGARSRMREEGPRWAAGFTPQRMAQGYHELYDLAAARQRSGVGKRKG